MHRPSLLALLALAAAACGSTSASRIPARATSAPSGLEEVTFLARGME